MIAPALLDEIPLLAGLGPGAASLLAAHATERSWPAGRTLYLAGNDPAGLIFILSGTIRVVRGHASRQHLVHEESAGGVLGAVALFGGTAYPATAITAVEARCLVVPTAALHGAMRLDGDLALRFLRHLADRARHLVDRLDALASRSLGSRLACRIADRAAGVDGSFSLGRSQLEIAEELGTVREVVVRLLRQFCDDGVLERAGRGRYRVRDLAALRVLTSR